MTADSQDIRVWAASAGYDLASKGRIPEAVKEAYALRDEKPEADYGDARVITVPGATEPPASSNRDKPPAPAERKPVPPPRKPGGLFGQRKPKTPGGKPRPRVSIENVVSSGWSVAAMAFARSPRAVPVARILDMQAPVAGIIVEDVAKGTLVDRLLQPLARGGEQAEKVVALAGPPLLVGVITARPELFPALRGVLKMSLMSWVQIAGPAMDKVAKRQERFAEEFGGVDLDAMIDALWADLPMPTVASEQEEANIRRARGDQSSS